MAESKLTHEAKELIREYLWKILVPVGGLASILLFVLGWGINELAIGTANNKAWESIKPQIIKIIEKISEAEVQIERAKRDMESAKNDVFDIRDDTKTARSILNDTVEKLSNDQNFITKVKKELDYTLDISTPKSKNWTQKPLTPIGDPNIRDSYDQPILWHDGTKIHKQQGLCFLTRISGKFEGGGEYVEVYIGKDDYWYLKGNSHQQDVAATAMCYKLKSRREK